jgi:8-oxo-dGTP pyrophosphatase MutT (NUDIX family)
MIRKELTMKRCDVFSEIESDVGRGMNVSKTWDEKKWIEQEKLNKLDMDEQRRTGGIKPMSEQFPGREDGVSDADVMESDRITRKNQLKSDLTSVIESKLVRMAGDQPTVITKPEGRKVIAFIEYPDGSRVAVAGGKAYNTTSEAMEAGRKQIEKQPKKLGSSNVKNTSTVAVMCANHLLMGQRRDNVKWTFPGGGCNDGEQPHAGAVRELYEEAGVRCDGLEHIGSKEVSGRTGHSINVHCFKLSLNERVHPNSYNDPDAEVAKWEWIDVANGVPPEIMIELQSPKNLLLQNLGLQK